jgi:hypothetical protein
MYNLILVDVDYDRTIIHRMNVITGDYLPPVYLRDDLPDKIIFDKAGKGHIFYYYFMERVRIHKEIDIDSFGLITYI